MSSQNVRMGSIVRVIAVLVASAWGLTLSGDSRSARPLVLPPSPEPFTTAYEDLEALWNKFMLEFPVSGHPAIDDPSFNVSARQNGPIWFLGAPFGSVVRNVTIPRDKALFFGLLTVECSSLEDPPFHGGTEAEQRAAAADLIDALVDVDSLFCTIDGVAVRNIEDFRFSSPQYHFNAPTPWIFGDVGGRGTSVADGYYVGLAPLSPGKHVLHYGGTFDFGGGDTLDLDMTYNITVK